MTGGSDSQHIGVPPLLPARGGLVLGLGEQELRIGGHIVALVGGNQFAALRFVRVLPIVKPLFQGLGDGFSLADLVLFEIGCGRRQPSFRYDKRRLLPAAARTLGQVVPKYQPVMKSCKEYFSEYSLSIDYQLKILLLVISSCCIKLAVV